MDRNMDQHDRAITAGIENGRMRASEAAKTILESYSRGGGSEDPNKIVFLLRDIDAKKCIAEIASMAMDLFAFFYHMHRGHVGKDDFAGCLTVFVQGLPESVVRVVQFISGGQIDLKEDDQ